MRQNLDLLKCDVIFILVMQIPCKCKTKYNNKKCEHNYLGSLSFNKNKSFDSQFMLSFRRCVCVFMYVCVGVRERVCVCVGGGRGRYN